MAGFFIIPLDEEREALQRRVLELELVRDSLVERLELSHRCWAKWEAEAKRLRAIVGPSAAIEMSEGT